MNAREIKKAAKRLAMVGRVVTGTIIDARGARPTTAIQTDGDGHKQPFGSPRVFSSMEAVESYVSDRVDASSAAAALGRIKSEKKAAASRANGAKGGRPARKTQE